MEQIYTTTTTKDIKLELVNSKRRTRDRRTETQPSDEFMMMIMMVTTIMVNGTRTKNQQVKGVRDEMRYEKRERGENSKTEMHYYRPEY